MTKFALSFAVVTLASVASFGGQRENFNACKNGDESWMRRWGNYVVGFELASSYDTCRTKHWPESASARQTGCYIGGKWAKAGYYCEVRTRR